MAAIYDGSLLRIKLDGQNVFHEVDASISVELGTRERATKDTSGVEVAPDLISWSATGNSLGVQEAEGSAHSFEGLMDKFLARGIVEVEFTLGASGTAGDVFYKGQGLLTSLEISAAVREDATASWSITGSGVPEKDTIA